MTNIFYNSIKTTIVVLKYLSVIIIIFFAGCKKYIEVDPPSTSLNAANVYLDDATATSVLTGMYTTLSSNMNSLTNNSIVSSSLYLGLSSDELSLFNLNDNGKAPYYQNNLTKTSATYLWNSTYDLIYTTNIAMEGLEKSNNLSPSVKNELIAEAKFVRAFCYFYLVNVYGDVPLPLSTDWSKNSLFPRTSVKDVYNQIVSDLKDAQSSLSNTYLNSNLTSTTDRTRPNKWVATALLARTYLYMGDYANAEIQASSIISNSLFSLNTLDKVFLKSSNVEAIWQLQPTKTGSASNTGEGALFLLPATGPNTAYPVYLSNSVVNSFEPGDLRKLNWVDSVKPGGTAYYFAKKYKAGQTVTTTSEYNMVFRLAEQYLIRAEARAQEDKKSEAQADLNVIRNRAGLPNTTASDKQSLLTAIMQERKVELFTEWGHRWFDLKRTNSVDTVMPGITPQKGGTWNSYKALFPIPQSEIVLDPQLSQNLGY